MKLNFKKTFDKLDGEPLPIVDETGTIIGDQLLSRNLANALTNATTDDPIKFYDWGISLYKEGFIEVDESDRKKLYDFIKSDKRIVNLMKGQLLKLIDKQVKELEDATNRVNGILEDKDSNKTSKSISKQE